MTVSACGGVVVIPFSALKVAAVDRGAVLFDTEEDMLREGGEACSSGLTVMSVVVVAGRDTGGGGGGLLLEDAEGKSNNRAIIIASACCSVSSFRRLPRFLLAQFLAIKNGPRHSWLTNVVSFLISCSIILL